MAREPRAPIGPFSIADGLRRLVPVGAPVLRIAPDGVPLPLTRPRARPSFPESREPGYLGRWSADMGRPYVVFALRGELEYASASERLDELLSAGLPRRADGLPGYWPNPTNEFQGRWVLDARGAGFLARAVITAVHMDLEGHRPARFGTLDAFRRLAGETIDRREPHRYRAKGRQLLATLGVWPWTHVVDGKLPYGWGGTLENVVPPFEEPFEQWLQRYDDGGTG
jgi:hypothetical protein